MNQKNIKNYEELITSTNIFGSVVEIDKKTYISKKISFGHRFPSGLFYDSSRDILWETEHGPRGGDELNMIENSHNYGWPNASYGLSYNKKNNSSFTKDSHNGFRKPLFSWTPSIGVSQIGSIKGYGKFYDIWNNNDLIISSLKNKSIYRNRIEEGKIIYSEKIYIGNRIRSLVVSPDVIFASTDDGSIIVIEPSEIPLRAGAF
tara:strand:- start:728 stop:1339 length:612 start_codon:yes stop_codon:yes gene_type:complete